MDGKKHCMKRRTLLATGATLAGAAALGLFPETAFAQSIDDRAFRELSQLLTGRKALDAEISNRALRALSDEDRSFPAAAVRLAAALSNVGLTDMRSFKDFASTHPADAATAYKIISAWYLGHTGTPAAESTVDDARYVSYVGALMYEPTIDATVIPTFSRGRTNYWANPPTSIVTD